MSALRLLASNTTKSLVGFGINNTQIQARRFLPYCAVNTTLKASELPEDFPKKLSKVIADTLGKDETLVTVSVHPETAMCRQASNDPNAVVSIWSIGVFDAEKNPKYVKPLYDYLIPTLNMKPERIALFFHPINKETAGHLLYADMMAKK